MTGRNKQQRFEALLHEHRRVVFKVAAVYAHDAEDRRDLEQEICVQLWRAFGGYDARRAKFSTWIYRIALNVAISQLRRDGSGVARHTEPLQAHHLETIGGGQEIETPDERLESLYAFIGQLEPLSRALILLYLEDRSYAEIAEVLGISETNVATKLGRIKERLRGEMTRAHPIGA